ncbi:MAG: formylglycine-generating enzyme family protein [Panacagrimonas sp.]
MVHGWQWRIAATVLAAAVLAPRPLVAQEVAVEAVPSSTQPAPTKPKAPPAKKNRSAKPAITSDERIRASCKPASRSGPIQPFEVFRDCLDTPEMVRIPGGRFFMGELGDTGLTYERPVREVIVPSFSIAKFELSFFEWDDCWNDRFCQKRPDDKDWGRGFNPVINVSWVDAQQYLAWLSKKTGQRYRLPSEAEWEYAARAGTSSGYHWGDSSFSTCDYANTLDIAGHQARPNWNWSTHCLDGFAFTSPVGSFPPNPWGLHDMAGNVWEWVQDCWHSDYTGAPPDASPWLGGNDADCEKRVNRGGGWGNHPRTLRTAKRDADSATGWGDAFGFRVVRDDAPEDVVSPAMEAAGSQPAGIDSPPQSAVTGQTPTGG